MKDYVSSKLEKLERHFDHISNVQVTLSVEKQRQIAEATLHISGGDVHATTENDDMYAAIDLLIDKLDRQILKHKERMSHVRTVTQADKTIPSANILYD